MLTPSPLLHLAFSSIAGACKNACHFTVLHGSVANADAHVAAGAS